MVNGTFTSLCASWCSVHSGEEVVKNRMIQKYEVAPGTHLPHRCSSILFLKTKHPEESSLGLVVRKTAPSSGSRVSCLSDVSGSSYTKAHITWNDATLSSMLSAVCCCCQTLVLCHGFWIWGNLHTLCLRGFVLTLPLLRSKRLLFPCGHAASVGNSLTFPLIRPQGELLGLLRHITANIYFF